MPMTPERVWERFLQEFPHMEKQVVKWFRRHTDSADSSIRIVLRNGNSMIFSINKDGTWILKRK